MKRPIPPEDLWDFLAEEENKRRPPEGCFTINQYADKFDKTYEEARGAVRRLEKEGKLEHVGRFTNRNMHYYRIVTSKGKSATASLGRLECVSGGNRKAASKRVRGVRG